MKYIVQIWGSNSRSDPHWMNVAHRSTLKSAKTEMEWFLAHGIKPNEIRITRIRKENTP